LRGPLALAVAAPLLVMGWWFAPRPGPSSDGGRSDGFSPQSSSTIVSATPDDAFEHAHLALARATGGFAVACPVPDHLPVPLLAGPLRTHGRLLRGTVDGQGGSARCVVETPDLLPFDGVARLADGSAPADLMLFGCEGGEALPDGRFQGWVVRGGGCTLVLQDWNLSLPSASLEVSSDGPRSGLTAILLARATVPDELDGPGLRDLMDAPSLERALTDPSLTTEARGVIHGWLTDVRAEREPSTKPRRPRAP
jgi:hypothetical protein